MQNFITAPHRGATGGPFGQTGSPNAALLIDFDNVTMGIRSDLTRQLKELLNSDIIKGKVAVQRAYADWRRYAQYIVPLSEASVDLIFAPAYGSSKKNATDIRLAIDALELVFTRPEIGTFILLSGDSDFSSLVLKLKEYGKYVVGVGLRESASDLLVQNCDEYYSYSSLTGLTRAGEEHTVASVDAWDLAERAVNQMAADGDVMRSDRLKQVMLELDPSFDEGQLGFTKFNKFLTEAASKNRLEARKLENGQYEVRPYERGEAEPREERARGRGRRDRKEEPRRESRERAATPARADTLRSEQAEATGARREQPARAHADQPASTRTEAPQRTPQEDRLAARPGTRERRAEGIDEGYQLLRQAVQALVERPGDAARDSDIKRKMIELESGWDEAALGFTKFSRFLRQAHDAEVVDLSRNPDGFYEARLARAAGRSESPARKDRERSRDREPGRDRGRDRAQPATAAAPDIPATQATQPAEPSAGAMDMPTVPAPESIAEGAAAELTPAETRRERDRARRRERTADRASGTAAVGPAQDAGEAVASPPSAEPRDQPVAEQEAGDVAPASEAASAPDRAGSAQQGSVAAKRAVGFGRRGRRAPADGPPPLLPGQVVGGRDGTAAGPAVEPEVAPAGVDAVESEASTVDPAHDPVFEPAAEPVVEAAAVQGIEEMLVTEHEPVARAAPASSPVDPEALGLPTDRGAVIRYLSNSYQGVGQKTAEALIDAFGEEGVFQGLNDQPERVKEILGAGRRTEVLLNAWQRDFRRRTAAGQGAGATAEANPS
jgi:uncharacterized protein (TIGR00288 family)